MGCRGWGRRRAKRGTLATGTRSPTDLTCSWPSPSASLIGVHLGRHLPPRTAGATASALEQGPGRGPPASLTRGIGDEGQAEPVERMT
ncbi:unspecified product [Leishmania tarentolae]|uniref:Unspecified product n=1 Tax=Leishmania tarentolae TaxID=5689 RepID=A0A640KWC0_LEITA|nr:unspecified product [Leishmania tarentolae]